MHDRLWLTVLAAGGATLPALPVRAEAVRPEVYRFHEDHVLCTSLDLVALAPGPGSAAVAVEAVRSEIRRLAAILSGHDPDSELSRLNRASGPVAVSRDLFAVLRAAEDWRLRTDGAFSARLGLALADWAGPAAGQGAAVLAARAAGGAVLLDEARRTVPRPEGVVCALDGSAKGYVRERALAAARRAVPDLSGLLLDIGGDIRCWGCPPGEDGWRVGLAGRDLADNLAPAEILSVRDGAVATSGRGARDVPVRGEARSHIMAAASGAPADRIRSAAVRAANALAADALSTAFASMEPERAVALADALPGVETRIETTDGRRLVSGGWDGAAPPASAAGPAPRPLKLAQDAGAAWPAGFGASVQYEVPRIESDNYKAPYVTIWVTDEKRNLVRTLLVLGNEPRWIDSNYVWWRRYGRKNTALVDAVSRPTRMPGRYSAVWDGKDDDGKAVPQGRYLVHVEASREHGGHSYLSGEVTLGTGAAEAALPAKDELGPTRFRYGPGA